jgi:hypothetical protein
MTHKAALRSNTSPVLLIELDGRPDFARPILSQTSYELQGDDNGNK